MYLLAKQVQIIIPINSTLAFLSAFYRHGCVISYKISNFTGPGTRSKKCTESSYHLVWSLQKGSMNEVHLFVPVHRMSHSPVFKVPASSICGGEGAKDPGGYGCFTVLTAFLLLTLP